MGMHEIANLKIRFRIGRCWLIIVRISKSILFNAFERLYKFFFVNMTAEDYEMNFTSAEFFLYLVDEEEEDIIKNNKISTILQNNFTK
jgi:hypothetical protein